MAVPDHNGPIEALAAWYWENRDSLPNRPWLPFYVKDWLGDPEVRAMTLGCRGAYVELLCMCHQGPLRTTLLSGGCGGSGEKRAWRRWYYPMLKDHFVPVSDGYVMNKRMLRIIAQLEKERLRTRRRRRMSAGCPSASSSSSDDDGYIDSTPRACNGTREGVRARSPGQSDPPDLSGNPELADHPHGHPVERLARLIGSMAKAQDAWDRLRHEHAHLDAWQEWERKHGTRAMVGKIQLYREPAEIRREVKPQTDNARRSSYRKPQEDLF